MNASIRPCEAPTVAKRYAVHRGVSKGVCEKKAGPTSGPAEERRSRHRATAGDADAKPTGRPTADARGGRRIREQTRKGGSGKSGDATQATISRRQRQAGRRKDERDRPNNDASRQRRHGRTATADAASRRRPNATTNGATEANRSERHETPRKQEERNRKPTAGPLGPPPRAKTEAARPAKQTQPRRTRTGGKRACRTRTAAASRSKTIHC